jgi:ABC-type transport system involved in multi-copper enzyme maturation permease subunit
MLRLLSSFLGPVCAKEMVEIARRKRYYFNRILYGIALLLTLFLVWQSNSWRFQAGRRQSIHAMAEVASALFSAVGTLQLLAVFLFVPVFLCGVIAGEREERTLELLFTTHLSDRQIVLGKLLSRIAVAMLIILGGLPVLSLIMLFGGIAPDALWHVSAVTQLCILYAGAHAIYFSTVTRSQMGALVRTYWWMAQWLLALPAMIALIAAARRGPPGPFAMYFLGSIPYLNPLGAFVVAQDPRLYAQMASSFLGEWFFPLTFVLPAAWSLLLIRRAVHRLRGEPAPARRWVRRLIFPRKAGAGALNSKTAAPVCTLRGLPERAGLIFRVHNPLWLRSRRARVYDREGHIGRIQLGSWLLALLFIGITAIANPRALFERGASPLFLVPTWIAVGGLTVILAGSSLVGDRRRGFLDLVLMTPLTPREIVDGNMLSIWEHLRRIYWLPVALCLFFCLTGSQALLGMFFSLTFATLFLAWLVLHGTACSLAARSAAPALVLAFLFPLLTIVGTVFMIPSFKESAGAALWVVSLFLFVATGSWVRRRGSAPAVGSYLMAVHLLAVSWMTCFIWGRGRPEDPILLINPGYLTVLFAAERPEHWFRSSAIIPLEVPCYAAALVSSWLYARWWLIRNFERITQQPGAGKARQESWRSSRSSSTSSMAPAASILLAGASGDESGTCM